MAIAEGRTVPFVGPEAIDVAVLETFEYSGPTRNRHRDPGVQRGLPLQRPAGLRHAHHPLQPADRCVELKSLKYYVTSYRNVGIFQDTPRRGSPRICSGCWSRRCWRSARYTMCGVGSRPGAP